MDDKNHKAAADLPKLIVTEYNPGDSYELELEPCQRAEADLPELILVEGPGDGSDLELEPCQRAEADLPELILVEGPGDGSDLELEPCQRAEVDLPELILAEDPGDGSDLKLEPCQRAEADLPELILVEGPGDGSDLELEPCQRAEADLPELILVEDPGDGSDMEDQKKVLLAWVGSDQPVNADDLAEITGLEPQRVNQVLKDLAERLIKMVEQPLESHEQTGRKEAYPDEAPESREDSEEQQIGQDRVDETAGGPGREDETGGLEDVIGDYEPGPLPEDEVEEDEAEESREAAVQEFSDVSESDEPSHEIKEEEWRWLGDDYESDLLKEYEIDEEWGWLGNDYESDMLPEYKIDEKWSWLGDDYEPDPLPEYEIEEDGEEEPIEAAGEEAFDFSEPDEAAPEISKDQWRWLAEDYQPALPELLPCEEPATAFAAAPEPEAELTMADVEPGKDSVETAPELDAELTIPVPDRDHEEIIEHDEPVSEAALPEPLPSEEPAPAFKTAPEPEAEQAMADVAPGKDAAEPPPEPEILQDVERYDEPASSEPLPSEEPVLAPTAAPEPEAEPDMADVEPGKDAAEPAPAEMGLDPLDALFKRIVEDEREKPKEAADDGEHALPALPEIIPSEEQAPAFMAAPEPEVEQAMADVEPGKDAAEPAPAEMGLDPLDALFKRIVEDEREKPKEAADDGEHAL
jgi:hypothetical protein